MPRAPSCHDVRTILFEVGDFSVVEFDHGLRRSVVINAVMRANRFLYDDAFRAVCAHDDVFVLAVDPQFFRHQHARSHDHAFRAHCERGGDLATGADAAADDDGQLDSGGAVGRLHHAADLVNAGMTAAFKAIDAHGVTATIAWNGSSS